MAAGLGMAACVCIVYSAYAFLYAYLDAVCVPEYLFLWQCVCE